MLEGVITVRVVSAAAAALAAVHWAAAARFLFFLRRERREGTGSWNPAVTVLVPCKGEMDLENIGTLLRQDYGGTREYLFIAPSRNDLAFRMLADFLPRSGAPARVLSSEAVPVHCSEALLNYMHGVSQAGADSEVLVFADADLRMEPDWLARLVAALEVPGTGVSTAVLMFVPATFGLWSFLRLLWMALGLPYQAMMSRVSGHSFAMRRADYARWDVAGLWSRCITSDIPLDAHVRAAGARVRYVPSAAPVCVEDCDRAAYFRVFNKWFLYARCYDPASWVILGGAMVFRLWMLFWLVRTPSALGILISYIASEAAYGAAVLWGLQRFLPEHFRGLAPALRPLPLWAGLMTPIALTLYLANYIAAAFQREVIWGGYRYRIRGPFQIEVVP